MVLYDTVRGILPAAFKRASGALHPEGGERVEPVKSGLRAQEAGLSLALDRQEEAHPPRAGFPGDSSKGVVGDGRVLGKANSLPSGSRGWLLTCGVPQFLWCKFLPGPLSGY